MSLQLRPLLGHLYFYRHGDATRSFWSVTAKEGNILTLLGGVICRIQENVSRTGDIIDTNGCRDGLAIDWHIPKDS